MIQPDADETARTWRKDGGGEGFQTWRKRRRVRIKPNPIQEESDEREGGKREIVSRRQEGDMQERGGKKKRQDGKRMWG
jgi:hypothetical protein